MCCALFGFVYINSAELNGTLVHNHSTVSRGLCPAPAALWQGEDNPLNFTCWKIGKIFLPNYKIQG